MNTKTEPMRVKPIVGINEIYQQVSDETNITFESVKYVCDTMFDVIAESLQRCQPVRVQNFGIFDIKTTKERMSRKPVTNEPLLAKPKNLPSFRYSKGLKELISEVTVVEVEDF